MNTTPAPPAPTTRKPNRTLLIAGGVILAVVLLCAGANALAIYNEKNPSKPLLQAPGTALPPLQGTALAEAYGQIVHAASGEVQNMDCSANTGMTVFLPSNDSVYIPCPADSVRLTSVGANELPAPLPEGMTFLAAMNIEVSPAVTNMIRVDFTPAGREYSGTAMLLYWRTTQEWIQEGELLPLGRTYAAMDGLFVLVSKE
jgi:hypothetical protein